MSRLYDETDEDRRYGLMMSANSGGLGGGGVQEWR